MPIFPCLLTSFILQEFFADPFSGFGFLKEVLHVVFLILHYFFLFHFIIKLFAGIILVLYIVLWTYGSKFLSRINLYSLNISNVWQVNFLSMSSLHLRGLKIETLICGRYLSRNFLSDGIVKSMHVWPWLSHVHTVLSGVCIFACILHENKYGITVVCVLSLLHCVSYFTKWVKVCIRNSIYVPYVYKECSSSTAKLVTVVRFHVFMARQLVHFADLGWIFSTRDDSKYWKFI